MSSCQSCFLRCVLPGVLGLALIGAGAAFGLCFIYESSFGAGLTHGKYTVSVPAAPSVSVKDAYFCSQKINRWTGCSL